MGVNISCGCNTVQISETDPSRSDAPAEPLRSDRLLMTKSPWQTFLRCRRRLI